MRIALDSNVLLYAEGLNDETRKVVARSLIQNLLRHELVIPVQVLGEVFNVSRRKLRYSSDEAALAVETWRQYASLIADTTKSAFELGLAIAAKHDFQIWDALILAASAEAGCRLLLSEDMQDGFVWRGVTVANPFAASLHPLLADTLRG